MDDVEGAQPRCDDCGSVTAISLAGWQSGMGWILAPVVSIQMPKPFAGRAIRGG